MNHDDLYALAQAVITTTKHSERPHVIGKWLLAAPEVIALIDENRRYREALEYIGAGSASDTGRHPGKVVKEYETMAREALHDH